MDSTSGTLATPYPTPDAAGQMVIKTLWAGGLILLGYLIALIAPIFTESVNAPGGGTALPIPFSATGPVVALLIVAAERKKLNDAAGRKLQSWEIGLIRNATAAGQLVDAPDLIVAQEYYARRHMKVTTAYITGLVMTLIALLPPALMLWLGALTPLAFATSSILVTLGVLYCAWWMVRRAAGSEATNAIFDAPLTPDEEASL